MASSVISIEFNELCPSLMADFIKEGFLPNFKALHDQSEVYTTTTEAEGDDLNPWIQWVTAHTGADFREHGVRFLSEGHRLEIPAVWDVVSDKGRKVWVCGSMNPRANNPINGCLLPDPWSTGVTPQPHGEFDGFFDFIRKHVQGHTSPDGPQPSAKRFGTFMIRKGLSFRTGIRVATHLLAERFRNVKWRRPMLMEEIQFDLFKHYYRKLKPAYSSFFANSTAHFQHCYWRHMDPSAFAAKPGKQEMQTYGRAIRAGYENMDRLLGKFRRLAGPETTLILSTAISQQPYLDCESSGGRRYYHVQSGDFIRDKLKLDRSFRFEQVMAEQFFLRFDSATDAESAMAEMKQLQVSDGDTTGNGNRELFHMTIEGPSLMCQCRCIKEVAHGTTISGPTLDQPIDFYSVFYQADTIKSGRHHPDGILWVCRPGAAHCVHEEKIPLGKMFGITLGELGLSPDPTPRLAVAMAEH